MNARMMVWFASVGVTGALAFGLAGCGGDDGAKGGGSTAGASTAIVAPGGADSNKTGPSAADKKYISEMCVVIKDFNAAVDKADINKIERGADVIKAVVGPFDVYAKGIAKITPPADLQDYHSTVVSNLNKTVKALGDGRGLEGFDSLAVDTVQQPPQLVTRLQKAAVGNADCKGTVYGTAPLP